MLNGEHFIFRFCNFQIFTFLMNVLELFKNITTFVFDVDGVLTDATVLLLENGVQARRMNIRDGLAFQMALKNGFRVVVISGAKSEPVLQRLKYLNVNDAYTGIEDKKAFLDNYVKENKLNWKEILFMGDDLPDMEPMQAAGVSACPADAIAEIQSFAHYISPAKGGEGCVRDVIEKVLKVQDKWIFGTHIVAK